MKITGISVWRLKGSFTRTWDDVDRVCRPLDIYDDYFKTRPDRNTSVIGQQKTVSLNFIEVETNEGLAGRFGPIPYRAELVIIVDLLQNVLIGQDPLDTETLWDRMSKADRHARSGFMMMAISAVDNALWDLKGKYLQKPVYQLLGGQSGGGHSRGGRSRLAAYGSMLGNSTLPERAAALAEKTKAMGHPAQKWFFPWGPKSGDSGIADNIALAAALREAVGADYPLMFDAWMGWDIPYAAKTCAALEKFNPFWLEEPFAPQDIDGYRELRKMTKVPLAAGEHLYARQEVKNVLDVGVLSVMQADPEWCGGISETMRIAELCAAANTPLIPHGNGIHAAAHVAAALPQTLCPWTEYLFTYMEQQTCLFKYPLKPENGIIALPDGVYGLGLDFDESKVETRERIAV